MRFSSCGWLGQFASVSLVLSIAACSSNKSSDTGDASTNVSDDANATSDPQQCILVCSKDDDCPTPMLNSCYNGGCSERPDSLRFCKADADCIPYRNQFYLDVACTSDAGCEATQACIAFRGGGICHTIEIAGDPTGRTCTNIPWKALDGRTVKLCADSDYVCDGGQCELGCKSDEECSTRTSVTQFPHCDPSRRRCVCTPGSCGSNGDIVCLPDGSCGCNSDADCYKNSQYDKCYGHTCGCSSTSACPARTTGLPPVACLPMRPL